MKSILKYFFQGLVSLVPITVTIYLIYKIFLVVDGLIPVNFPGLGLLIILAGITLVGFIINHFISDRIISGVNGIIRRAPLINLVYTAVKDMMQAFVGKKRSFSQPVLVQLTKDSPVRRLGFITNDNFKNQDQGIDLLSVYIPHSYNISGNLYLVPPEYVQPIKTNSSEFMKYSVSGGVTELEELTILPSPKNQ